MKRFGSRLVAAAAAVSLAVQSTGAASLPAALVAPAGAFSRPAPAAFAARPAAARPAAAPAGPSWLDSAKIVAGYLLEQARGESVSAPAPAEQAPPASAPLVEPPALSAPSAAAERPADRMLIAMEPGVSLEAVLEPAFAAAHDVVHAPFAVLPTFHEKWIESGGLRARLSYLRPHGMVKGDAGGFTAVYPGGPPRRWDSPMPEAYRRDFPIFFHGESVEMALTVENKTAGVLRDVRVEADQEAFRENGTAGAPLLPTVVIEVGELAPGASKTIRWRTLLAAPSVAPVNVEQTHVRVSAGGAASLLDAPQAGAVDPPGPGMLPKR